MSGNGNVWWDDYNGEKVVCFDEFRGQVPYFQLLKYLDGYPITVSKKGGTALLEATKIYITSDRSPNEWYNYDKVGAYDQLFRRITEIFQTGKVLDKTGTGGNTNLQSLTIPAASSMGK